MNRFPLTTLWGVTAYRMWEVASLGMASCASSYAAAASIMSGAAARGKIARARPVPNETAPLGAARAVNAPTKPASMAVQSPVTPRATIPATTIEMPPKEPASPRLLVPHETTPPLDTPAQPAGTQMNLGAENEKEFVPRPAVQGKAGKKKKNRPQALGSTPAKDVPGPDS
jgi:hypothetical protein